MKSDALTIRIEHETLTRVTELLNDLGLTASVAVNMFFRQMLREEGLPFLPRRDRLSDEAVRRLSEPVDQLVSYSNVDEFKKAMHAYVESDED